MCATDQQAHYLPFVTIENAFPSAVQHQVCLLLMHPGTGHAGSTDTMLDSSYLQLMLQKRYVTASAAAAAAPYLEHTTCLLVNQSTDALHTTTTSQAPNGGLGDACMTYVWVQKSMRLTCAASKSQSSKQRNCMRCTHKPWLLGWHRNSIRLLATDPNTQDTHNHA
jgi:hypothetical protein